MKKYQQMKLLRIWQIQVYNLQKFIQIPKKNIQKKIKQKKKYTKEKNTKEKITKEKCTKEILPKITPLKILKIQKYHKIQLIKQLV